MSLYDTIYMYLQNDPIFMLNSIKNELEHEKLFVGIQNKIGDMVVILTKLKGEYTNEDINKIDELINYFINLKDTIEIPDNVSLRVIATIVKLFEDIKVFKTALDQIKNEFAGAQYTQYRYGS